MGKNNKKARKNKEKVSPACTEQSSLQIDGHTSSGKCKGFNEEASSEVGSSQNKEDNVSPLDMLHSNTEKLDTPEVKPEPLESNEDELSHLKNTCRAMKSNLNAMKKKCDEERKLREDVEIENKQLKSVLSTIERELEAAKMEIEKLKKENRPTHPRDFSPMEIVAAEGGVSQQPQHEASYEGTWEEKYQDAIQNSSQGTCEESQPIGKQDTEMSSWDDGDQSGTYEQRWSIGKQDSEMSNWDDGNQSVHAQRSVPVASDQRLRGDAPDWGGTAEAGSSSRPGSYGAALMARGSDTRQTVGKGSKTRQEYNNRQPWNEGRQDQHKFGRGNSLRLDRNHWQNRNEQQRYDRPVGGDNTRQGHYDRQQRNEQQYHRHQYDACRGANIRDNNFRARGRGMDHRDHRGQNNDHNVNNDNRRTPDDELPSVVNEVSGDLFTAPPEFSLAHCVAEDMRMGSGIAVTFRQMFKRVPELLDQRKRQGQVALLEVDGRFIYYLVTKPESTGKPTIETLERSLLAMREHVVANCVTKIAMPRIGCGLDRLQWSSVKPLIDKTFRGTGAQITIYNYNEDVAESSKPKPNSYLRLKTGARPVAEIAPNTAILCLCAEDGSVDSTFRLLDRKFRIMKPYQEMDKKLGNIHFIQNPCYLIILLIVKERGDSLLSFTALDTCMRQACKVIEKNEYYYVAIEAFDDENDPFVFDRVITVVKAGLDTKREKELWLCWPTTVSRKENTRSNRET